MKAIKLLQTSKKEILLKPKRPKILYQTYRSLDKSKKVKKKNDSQQVSSNDNENFLQKLLQKEEQQKKEKLLKKSSKIKGKNQNKNENEQINFNESELMIINKYLNPERKSRFSKVPNERISPEFKNQKKERSKKLKQKRQINQNDAMKILSQQPYISVKSLQNKNDMEQIKLKENGQKIKCRTISNFVIRSHMNSENQQVLNDFIRKRVWNQLKAKMISSQKVLSMCGSCQLLRNQQKFINRNKLFINLEEQERFIKHLQSYKITK